MPKKRNFLGGMQNYNAQTGEYEPALKGPNGESPSGFKSFKKQKDNDESFDTINKKRINGSKYGSSWKEGDSLSQSELEVFNEISKMKKEGNYDREKLKEKFEGITDEDIDNMEKAYQIDNPQNNESFDTVNKKRMGKDTDFTSEDYVDDFYDRVSDLQKEINTSGIDDDEYDAKINKLKEELETKKDSMSEDDYNKTKEMLDRFSRPTDDDFDANDEDSIWNAFESGKITEEERNKMLSKRSGKIANESFDETNAKRMGKGKSKLPF